MSPNTTRRNVLRGIGITLCGAPLKTAATADTEEIEGVVDRILTDVPQEPGIIVVLTNDGREITGSPDVYDIREGDAVRATVRNGEIISLEKRDQETEERRERARKRFNGLSRRPKTGTR